MTPEEWEAFVANGDPPAGGKTNPGSLTDPNPVEPYIVDLSVLIRAPSQEAALELAQMLTDLLSQSTSDCVVRKVRKAPTGPPQRA